MATKKQEKLSGEEILQETTPQTDGNPELEELSQPEDDSPDPELSQTDTEDSLERVSSEEFRDADSEGEILPQTDMEMADGKPPSEPEEKISSQTDSPRDDISSENALGEEPSQGDVSQTEPEKVKKPRGRKKTKENTSQSDTEANPEGKNIADGVEEAPKPRKRRVSVRPTTPVLAIDDQLSVETDAEKAKNDLLDLLESQKTGRILTGTIQGVERPEDNPSRSFAVIYHGEFKVIIPAEEAVEPPADYRGRLPEDVLHYMLTKRLGAEVDYIVRGIDPSSGIAAASRLEAMKAKRKQYYLGTDRDGNNLLYSGVCEVDRSDRNHVKATASVKQSGENPYEKALRRYSVGNRYVGTVSMVDTNGVFVALDGGIDCLCSYPKRGRPPRGSRVTVRILGINHDSNRIWGAITHIAAPR